MMMMMMIFYTADNWVIKKIVVRGLGSLTPIFVQFSFLLLYTGLDFRTFFLQTVDNLTQSIAIAKALGIC